VSLLLALEAQRLGGGAEASSALFSTLESAPGFLGNIGADQRAPAFTTVAVTADNHLVVGDAAGRLVQFDMATHRRLGHPVQVGDRGELITLLATDPAGRHLVVGLDASRAIYLFDAGALSALRPEGGGSGLAVELADVPSTIAVSADGAVAVSGRDTGTVTVLDVGTGAIRATIPAAGGPTSVAIAPDGTLAIGSSEGITLLERDTYTPLASFSGDGIAADGSLQFSADGARLLSGEHTTGGAARYDILNNLAVWDIGQHRELWRSSPDARCFDTAIVASNVLCSGRSPALAFELETGRPSPSVLSAHPGFTQDLAIAPDHTTLVVGGRNLPVAYEFSLDGRSTVGQLVGRPGTYPVNYRPDGKTIMTESGTTSVGNSPALGPRQIWDTATADLIDTVNVLAGVYAPDGRIAALLDDLTFALIDPDTGKRTPITPGPSIEITYVAFDASQSRVAIGLADGSVHQRDLRTGEPTGAVIGTADVGVSSVAYVRAGAVIAVARADQIEFFDPDTGRSVLEPLPGRSVTASADGSILVTVDPNGNIAVRDPTTGRRDGTSMVAAADAPNHFLSLSDDNERLLVTSGDGTVRLFDLTTHEQIGDVIPLSIVASNVGHIGGVIRPDGRQMALATENGVQLWDLDPSEWRKAACQLAGRNLTQAEWDRYLPSTEPYHETCPEWRRPTGAEDFESERPSSARATRWEPARARHLPTVASSIAV
jgi:WD40 repeat protein